jgi:hypothetical protein
MALSLFLGLHGWVQAAPAPVETSSGYNSYQVFAFNDLGMHCYDNDFSVFSLLPLFNVVHAQVINKGIKPQIVTNSTFMVNYAATYDLNGSINTTSIGKTNFWDYLNKLFGVPQLPDTGILGYKMPSDSFGPQAMAFDPGCKWFSATGIPLTNIDDLGNVNSFAMMRIEATDKSTNLPRSFLDIVVPASSEMNCASCHETDAFVVPGVTASDASPPPRVTTLGPGDFSANLNPTIRFRENILLLHDALSDTSLVAQYQGGNPVLCASCHYSKALDLAGNNQPTGAQVGHLYLSRAMHKHHGTSWPTPGMGDPYTVPIPGTGVTQCYYCHPGNDTQCLRSVMAVNGMQCQSCHGELLAVGGFTPQLGQPGFVDPYLPSVSDPGLVVNLTSTLAQRRPWVDMPKCQSCHSGDVLSHLGANLIGMLAYDLNDPAATPLTAVNQRFAENSGQIYRFSQTHGGMACESCHGSPHAEWPAKINTNDNITATQLQGHTGEIVECGVCHLQDLSPSLGGPHGLHNVNDPGWLAQHGVFMQQNRNSCKACHGLDLHGTVLSRAKADRTLSRSKILGGVTTIAKGNPVDCYACHTYIGLGNMAPILEMLLQ